MEKSLTKNGDAPQGGVAKRSYVKPELTEFGNVRDLTRAATNTEGDGKSGSMGPLGG